MSILQGATNVAISGGTYIAAAAASTVTVNLGGGPGATSAFKDLSAAAAHTALPDSAARVNAPRCHRTTRAKYLNKFERWMLGAGDELHGQRVIWLNGGAGAGKSAIMQSIIERCACHAVILGAFFFSRTDASRNCVDVLISTLAYQLACAYPAAMAVLEPIILGNPLIFKASPSTQAYQLLVRPILYLIETGIIDANSALRRVFVIDGLDECSDPQKQALIIRLVASVLCDNHVPINFLISSRPEVAITSAFQREKKLLPIFASITLHDDEDAQSDIRQFLEDGFLDILDSHPLTMYIQLPWPSALSVDNLVRKSSGHFIYAATAIKFISSSDEHPRRALEVVEGIVSSRTGSPFAELDALYTHILTHARYSKEVLTILKHVYLRRWSSSFGALCYIHDFSPEDVVLFLSDVQSLISLTPNPHTAGMAITSKHASLHDFLTNEQRSGALHIEHYAYHTSLLKRYFQLVDNGPQTLASGYSLQHNDLNELIGGISDAIYGLSRYQGVELHLLLVDRHSCYNIWNFCIEFYALGAEPWWDISLRSWICDPIYEYMHAVCRNGIDDDRILCHQLKLHTQLVLDDLEDVVRGKPQYRIIPAIMFSTNPSGLRWADNLLKLWGFRFRVDAFYQHLFFDIVLEFTEPYFKAIRSLPESRASWGSDLAFLMKLVLSQLVDISRPSGIRSTSPHKQWLRRNKPLKHLALGSPRLSSTFFSNLFMWTYPDKRTVGGSRFHSDRPGEKSNMWDHWRGWRTFSRKMKCLTLLKAVVFYLRKSDCTIEVVKLAQRSLPMAAQWYPKLIKTVRAEMDAYVRRWEDSQNGLSKITGLVNIRR